MVAATFRLLLHKGVVTAGGGGAFFFLEPFCGTWDSLKFFLELPYIQLQVLLSAVAVTVLATGIWVVTAALVVTVGVGSVDKVGSVGKVGLVGCAVTLTLNLLFTGTLALFLLPSWVLGSFLARSFCQAKICWCMVEIGVGCQACLPVLNMFSSFLSVMDRDGVLHSLQGLQDMTWVVWSLVNVWMPLIIMIFTSTSNVSIGNRHLKNSCKSCILV